MKQINKANNLIALLLNDLDPDLFWLVTVPTSVHLLLLETGAMDYSKGFRSRYHIDVLV